jgi:Rod binding domain-containing protein
MSIDLSSITQSNQTGALDAQANRLLKQAQSSSATGSAPSREDAKITKAGKDFESILLGSWLQQAENSFATVPGGDGENDGDSGKDQFQGIAMQAMAGSLTANGGIGIAKMITSHLHAAADKETTSGKQTGSAGSTIISPRKET